MANKFIMGDKLILFVWDIIAWKPIACLTSNSLKRTKEVVSTQTKCEPGVVINSPGAKSYTIDFEGNYIDTTSAIGGDESKASHDLLMELFDLDETTEWRLDTGLAEATRVSYFGEGIFTDLELTAPANEIANFSGTINGSGLITFVDPHNP